MTGSAGAVSSALPGEERWLEIRDVGPGVLYFQRDAGACLCLQRGDNGTEYFPSTGGGIAVSSAEVHRSAASSRGKAEDFPIAKNKHEVTGHAQFKRIEAPHTPRGYIGSPVFKGHAFPEGLMLSAKSHCFVFVPQATMQLKDAAALIVFTQQQGP
ncbi:hypothetical protein AAFF_G00402150 [Aldrovandia affinis]|uniref:Uncharacterized protein n=1 Tax=Aldrovandia affinis TaxID=143900 RepID=A0AAD7T7K3_9TELE|nr:hypothetical protein AAFF_G00402150 [Aldrovandia affinis]